MRAFALATLLGSFAFSVAHAATLTVEVGGQENTYTLGSLTVDSSGNVKATAASGGSTQPPVDSAPPPVDSAPPPVDSAPPPSTDSGAGCVSSSNLTCVSTSLPTQTFQRQSYKPSQSMVYSFRIKAPSSGTLYARAIATRMTGATQSKLLVVSKIPGDVSTTGKDRGCYRQSTEASTLQFVMNRPDVSKVLTCHLEPNTVYYINAASTNYTGGATCSSSSNCGFYFEGS